MLELEENDIRKKKWDREENENMGGLKEKEEAFLFLGSHKGFFLNIKQYTTLIPGLAKGSIIISTVNTKLS